MAMSAQIETAIRRSREAEYATDDAAAESTATAHRHAAELHQDAARWHRKAGTPSRADVHEESARVHLKLAGILMAEDGVEV